MVSGSGHRTGRRRHVRPGGGSPSMTCCGGVPSGWFVPRHRVPLRDHGRSVRRGYHGKNNHRSGASLSTSRHHADACRRFGGDRRAQDPLFQASAGGMGLHWCPSLHCAYVCCRSRPPEWWWTPRGSATSGLLAAMLDADGQPTPLPGWTRWRAEEPRTLSPHHRRACPARGSSGSDALPAAHVFARANLRTPANAQLGTESIVRVGLQ